MIDRMRNDVRTEMRTERKMLMSDVDAKSTCPQSGYARNPCLLTPPGLRCISWYQFVPALHGMDVLNLYRCKQGMTFFTTCVAEVFRDRISFFTT